MLKNRLLHRFFVKLKETSEKTLIEEFYSTSDFRHMLRIEQKRAHRSMKPFLLMLLDLSAINTKQYDHYTLQEIKKILISCSRETDIRGWYVRDSIAGTIFTEMASVDENSMQTISHKVHKKISDTFHDELEGKIKISFRPIVPSPVLRFFPQPMPVKKYDRKEIEAPRVFQASINVNNHATHLIRSLDAFTKRVLEDIEKNMISETDGQSLIVSANIMVSMFTKT